MSLRITILTIAGTLANGRAKLAASGYNVSPVSGFTRDLVKMLGCETAYGELSEDVQGVEIDPAGLLALEIVADLNMINGRCFDTVSSAIGELALAQIAARAPSARVMIEPGL